MKAVCVYYDTINDVEQVDVNGHMFQFGGMGDGYCYGHQDFDCIENLTPEESEALKNIDYSES